LRLSLHLLRIRFEDPPEDRFRLRGVVLSQQREPSAPEQHQGIVRHGPQAGLDELRIVDHQAVDPADHQQLVGPALAAADQRLGMGERLPGPPFDLEQNRQPLVRLPALWVHGQCAAQAGLGGACLPRRDQVLRCAVLGANELRGRVLGNAKQVAHGPLGLAAPGRRLTCDHQRGRAVGPLLQQAQRVPLGGIVVSLRQRAGRLPEQPRPGIGQEDRAQTDRGAHQEERHDPPPVAGGKPRGGGVQCAGKSRAAHRLRQAATSAR